MIVGWWVSPTLRVIRRGRLFHSVALIEGSWIAGMTRSVRNRNRLAKRSRLI